MEVKRRRQVEVKRRDQSCVVKGGETGGGKEGRPVMRGKGEKTGVGIKGEETGVNVGETSQGKGRRQVKAKGRRWVKVKWKRQVE